VSLGWVVSTVGKICFVFGIILRTAYTIDAYTLTSILPSLFTADTKATPALVEDIGVDFYIDTDFQAGRQPLI
jgi:hypothetical protein